MATFSKKVMGKEVGDGAVYAPPHTMTGKAVKVSETPGSGPNRSSANTVDMAVGNISATLKVSLQRHPALRCAAQAQQLKA